MLHTNVLSRTPKGGSSWRRPSRSGGLAPLSNSNNNNSNDNNNDDNNGNSNSNQL